MSRARPVAAGGLAAALLLGAALAAQRPTQKVPLGLVLTSFLADSAARITSLPWTTGAALPIRWRSAAPVANPDQWSAKQGFTHVRDGAFLGTLGDSVALVMKIQARGTQAGITQLGVTIDSMMVTTKGGGGYFVNREMIEAALRSGGVELKPLKCDRAKEGASYGNLVDAFRGPGKNASGLWWYWDSPQQELVVNLTILYRRADMAQVECNEG